MPPLTLRIPLPSDTPTAPLDAPRARVLSFCFFWLSPGMPRAGTGGGVVWARGGNSGGINAPRAVPGEWHLRAPVGAATRVCAKPAG